MKKKKFLTSGEFAKLCATTKDTLFHYDREGLLKPKHTSGNGYRRYAAEQFFEFDMITVLKEAGSSLKEIRNYLDNYDPRHFVGILEEKLVQLEQERRRLVHRQETLKHIGEVTKAALTGDYGKIELMEQEEECLIVVKVDRPEEKGNSWSSMAHYLGEHFIHCEELMLTTVSPLGSIIQRDDLCRGIFGEIYYFSTSEKKITSRYAMAKPAGLYAVMLHKGSYDSLLDKLPDILSRLEKLGVYPCGDAYIYDLLSYLASANEENDVQKIAIQVSRIPEAGAVQENRRF